MKKTTPTLLTPEMIDAVRNYFHDLFEDVCPFCKTPITKRYQQGRCVFAEPCHHRLYVGQLPREGQRV